MSEPVETRPDGRSNEAGVSTQNYAGVPALVDHSPPDAFPGHVLLETLGRGGMGIVYKARQLELGRVVALKVIVSGRQADQEELIRFLAEAQAVAVIEHPHVVRVHEYGETSGRPYLVMEYLPGGSLADRLRRDGKFDAILAANIIAKLARGVHAAHDQGIIHCDLKPGNVLFDSLNEPKVTDFGLAKRSVGTELTLTRVVMGTPSYMSPEQALGKTKFVGPQADVYALGVILYECLTGRLPFADADIHVLLRRVIEDDPPPPSKVVPGLSRDLDSIVLACLAKSPADRYQTALDMAEDLDRFTAGEPVAVRSVGKAERAWKWVKRKPVLAAAYTLTAAVLFLFAFGAILSVLWWRSEHARNTAEQLQRSEMKARATAEAARSEFEAAGEKSSRAEYGRTIEAAHQEWRDGNRVASLALLDSTRSDLRGWEWAYVKRLWEVRHIDLKGESSGVFAVSWSPDGSRLATAGEGDSVCMFDTRTGDRVAVLRSHSGSIKAMAWSPDGSQLASGSLDATAVLWNARTGRATHTLELPRASVMSVSWNRDGSRIAIAGRNQARVWNARSGALEFALSGHEAMLSLTQVSWSPDGSWLATSGEDNFSKSVAARIFDARTGAPKHKLAGHTGAVTSAVWSPDGTRLATVCHDRMVGISTVRIWDARTGLPVITKTTSAHSREIRLLGWSLDGTRLATAGDESTVRIWDAKTGALALALSGHSGAVTALAGSPDGSRLATTSADRTARIWDASTGGEVLSFETAATLVSWSPDSTSVATASAGSDTAQIWDVTAVSESQQLSGHAAPVTAVAWSPDGSRLATTSDDRTARVWNARTGTLNLTLEGHSGSLTSVSWSPDGSRLATGSNDKTVRLWHAQNGGSRISLNGHQGAVTAVAWSPDGSLIATASEDKRVGLWDSRSGAHAFALEGKTRKISDSYYTTKDDRKLPLLDVLHSPSNWVELSSYPVTAVAWSRDGSRLLSVDDSARVWDVRSRTQVRLIEIRSMRSVAWSPDGSRLAAARGENTARVWDVQSGEEIASLPGHTSTVTSVAFSPDGLRLATGSDDRTARVWDAKTGAMMLILKGHSGAVTAVAWSTDGKRLATASDDTTVRIWGPRSQSEIREPSR
jgi:WD40 repeat protein/tRNA A-37 threonylcarbamoyl transferase component Bud32